MFVMPYLQIFIFFNCVRCAIYIGEFCFSCQKVIVILWAMMYSFQSLVYCFPEQTINLNHIILNVNKWESH